MRTRTFTIALLAIAVGPGLLIYGFTRTSLYRAMVKFFGTETMLVLALLLLAALIGAAVYAVFYGFAQEDDRTSRHRRRRRDEA
jgi:hypothetical protein